MRKIYSPLLYPGGKAKILNFMKELLDNNFASKKPAYVEPYAGGAAVALGLLIEGYVSKISTNDRPRFMDKYNNFMQSAAAHMAFFAPIMSELTKLF
jgi:site-specific DNA-adenine methylase